MTELIISGDHLKDEFQFESKHNLALVHLMNTIVTDTPLLDDLKETQKAVWRLGRVIYTFEKSFLCGQTIKVPMIITDQNIIDISSVIRNWLLNYYNAESLICMFDFSFYFNSLLIVHFLDTLKIEEGNEQEISTASLLVLNVFYQLRNVLSSYRAYFELGWSYLAEFDHQLNSLWRTDKLLNLLQNELECERNQRNLEKNKLIKVQKDVLSLKNKLQQAKATIESLKEKNKGKIIKEKEIGKKGRPKLHGNQDSGSEIEADIPPAPGTPVLLSSSGSGASCRYCGKWFSCSSKLNRHTVVHSGFKPFSCDWPGCGRPFDSNYKLQRHRRCHTGERPFACNLCEKRFTRSDKLREHKRLHERQQQTKDDEAKKAQEQQQSQMEAQVYLI